MYKFLINLCQCLGEFWQNWSRIKIQVFPSPTSYMLISFSFPLLIVDIFSDSSEMIGDLAKSLELKLVNSQTQPAHV